MGLQSGVGELGGLNGPQISRSKYAADGYKGSYAVFLRAAGGYSLFYCLSWYLTHDLARDVSHVWYERNRVENKGRLYTQVVRLV